MTRGLDHGSTTLQWHLWRDPTMKGAVPSVATIHRILVRRGLVTPQPHRRPKVVVDPLRGAPPERVVADRFHAMDRCGRAVSVFNTIDDHSRVLVRSKAVEHPTTIEAWATFCEATLVWGMPAGVLSDNGLAFSGKLHGFETVFEANLRDAGSDRSTGDHFIPDHRQSRTVPADHEEMAAQQSLAADVAELQAQLDTFADYYNNERPHQGIGRVTPASRWHASDRAAPSADPLEHPDYAPHTPTRHDLTVTAAARSASATTSSTSALLTPAAPAVVMADERWVNVYIDGLLVRHSRLDPTPLPTLRETPRRATPTTPDKLTLPMSRDIRVTDVPRQNIAALKAYSHRIAAAEGRSGGGPTHRHVSHGGIV